MLLLIVRTLSTIPITTSASVEYKSYIPSTLKNMATSIKD